MGYVRVHSQQHNKINKHGIKGTNNEEVQKEAIMNSLLNDQTHYYRFDKLIARK
jgi:hypothetical protein